jgi:cellulose synthase/poly-beta-1,6-N-acetylglucosamine synthase-like glycosyltransferase
VNAAIDVGDGRFLVPGNRWDLLPSPSAPPRVSVVVPYFEQQAQLDRLLTGIEAQTGHAELVEVIVADDGSPRPPHVPPWYRGPPVTVVTQADEGIRPAAARNLGVSRARGQVVVFLDGDMVPAPGYVAGMARLPAVAPDTVVVGTRRHWDLEDWDH